MVSKMVTDIQEDHYRDTFMQHRIYTFFYGSVDELRDFFHPSDLSEFIYLASETNSDYLPNLEEKIRPATNEETRYTIMLLHDQIILPNNFEKQVKGNQLVITWTAKEAKKKRRFLIIVYQDSQLVLNHQVLNREDKTFHYRSSNSHKPKGQNTLVLSYKQQWWLLP